VQSDVNAIILTYNCTVTINIRNVDVIQPVESPLKLYSVHVQYTVLYGCMASTGDTEYRDSTKSSAVHCGKVGYVAVRRRGITLKCGLRRTVGSVPGDVCGSDSLVIRRVHEGETPNQNILFQHENYIQRITIYLRIASIFDHIKHSDCVHLQRWYPDWI
jgi:hypothetical protein